MNWLDFCSTTGKNVRAAVMQIYNTPEAAKKLGTGKGGDITRQIDKVAEDVVIEACKGMDVLLISEEAGEISFGNAEHILVVDPVDGSFNARTGHGHFGFSIAVYKTRDFDSAIFGYIMDLVTGDEYYAEKGNGAFKNGTAIKTNNNTEVRNIVNSFSPSKTREEIMKFAELMLKVRRSRSFGTIAVNLMGVADGTFDCLYHMGKTRAYDIAAAKIIVEEAGGLTCNSEGEPIKGKLSIDSKFNFFAFANEEIKKNVIK